MYYIFGFTCYCSRNRDREKCYAYVVKRLIIQKGVVDSSFLIKGFYRQGLESPLIGYSPLGWSYCHSVNLGRCKFYFDEFLSYHKIVCGCCWVAFQFVSLLLCFWEISLPRFPVGERCVECLQESCK